MKNDIFGGCVVNELGKVMDLHAKLFYSECMVENEFGKNESYKICTKWGLNDNYPISFEVVMLEILL